MREIRKSCPGVQPLRGVDLDVHPGEVPELDGVAVAFRSPEERRRAAVLVDRARHRDGR
jgi:hypothetical protein